MNARKWLAGVAVVGTVGAGVLSASAQEGQLQLRRDGLMRGVLQLTADETGLETDAILEQLRDGMTLAEVIEANGGDVQAVIDAAVAEAIERLNQAVADERITQEQADNWLERLQTAVEAGMNEELPLRRTLRERVEDRVQINVLQLAAEETGLSAREIAAEVRDGSTLAQVLTENGVDVNAFIEEAVALADARLDQAVSNGRITQERADEMLENLRERLTERLTVTSAI